MRVGLGVTFVWIGVLIFRDPVSWGSLVQPWAAGLIGPEVLRQLMFSTAVLDILIGLALLADVAVFWAAGLAFLHVASVLVVVGINDITVRDIAILAGALAVMTDTWPQSLRIHGRP